MPRLTQAVPKYRKHRASGLALVTLNGRDHYLGPHGTNASKREYDRVVAEWLVSNRQPLHSDPLGLTITELAARYHAHARRHYTKAGKPTPELGKVQTALRCILRHYADHVAAEFKPTHLKVVRQSMIEAGWARSYINQETRVICRIFKWAVTEGLLPAAVHNALDLVDGLRRGESAARETSKVRGVDNATVQATLAHLSPTVRAMIELQLATGMRPGELCILRACDVDRSGDVWEYRPTHHKSEVYDHDRVIYIGPTGQDILRPYLLRSADSFCFSPKESAEWHRTQRHEARRTPLSCGNRPGTNVKRCPNRSPGDRYDVPSYRRAIHRACDIAFPVAVSDADDPAAVAKWQSDHRWSPHQLRHSMATRIRREFDIESAKAVLGHSSCNVTGIYAEVDRRRAIEVARKIG